MPAGAGDKLWFDGYNGQRAAVFEELRSQVQLDYLKSLCDRYDMQVPVKGGFVPWSVDRIYVTSQVHPDQCWADDRDVAPADRAAFAARCYIVQFDHVAQGPASRLADCVSALGGAAALQASLPAHARPSPSIWYNWHPLQGAIAAAGRSSANLHVPDLQRSGGFPQRGVSVSGPGSLETRLTALNPSYGVTSPIRPPHL